MDKNEESISSGLKKIARNLAQQILTGRLLFHQECWEMKAFQIQTHAYFLICPFLVLFSSRISTNFYFSLLSTFDEIIASAVSTWVRYHRWFFDTFQSNTTNNTFYISVLQNRVNKNQIILGGTGRYWAYQTPWHKHIHKLNRSLDERFLWNWKHRSFLKLIRDLLRQ